MPVCPECGDLIYELEISYSSIQTYRLRVVEKEARTELLEVYDETFINAVCPECYEVLFTSRGEAIDFLR